jgi:RNA polymerase sigma-70 factor (ECF subfamily)
MTRLVLERVTPILPNPHGRWDWTAALALCLRVTGRILGSREAAEDAAQQALERALRSERTRADLDDPDAWLARIAQREALRIWQREQQIRVRRTSAVGLEALAGPDRDMERLEDRMQLEAMTAGLAPDDRRIITLKYQDDLTQQQIANRLGIPEGNAKVRLHRARKKLERELRDRA